jgi:hypothetical protein
VIRQRLGIVAGAGDQAALPAVAPIAGPQMGTPFAPSSDDDMQRLLRLLDDQTTTAHNGTAHGVVASAAIEIADAADAGIVASAQDGPPIVASVEGTADEVVARSTPDEGIVAGRAALVAEMRRYVEIAAHTPEIIDWHKLRGVVVARLRGAAQYATGDDLTPAAALMLEGKLMQRASLPDPSALALLGQSLARLATPVTPADLGALGGELAQW